MPAQQPAEINAAWAAAFNARDVAAMSAVYEPDAVVVPAPGADPITGLAAIESSLRQLVGLGGTITFELRYWHQHGDLAVGSIDFHLTGATAPDGSPLELRGRTAEVARRQSDGTWKYVYDHPFSDA